jgi:succinate dehydrogenase / fumarate reductase cytochrome b subunit
MARIMGGRLFYFRHVLYWLQHNPSGTRMAELPSRAAAEARRPLSPHLQIYRPMLTMMMSIAHRITGVALYAGTLLLAWFLIAAATDARAFATAAWALNSILGQLVLLGFTWALFHHLLGGIRHFVWDAGYGMDHPEREWLAQATLVGGIVLTVAVWALSIFLR